MPHTGRARDRPDRPARGRQVDHDLGPGRRVAGGRRRVGVLAVDPSSPFSGGALLGDRVRMQDHATDPGVFIRSMATRGHLGGLAAATPQALRVLDAAGCDVVLIETWASGRPRSRWCARRHHGGAARPGMGDGIQAAKAGILEIADVFVVNKADRDGAEQAVRDLRHMLALGGGTEAGAGGRRSSRPWPPAARASTSWSPRWTSTGTGWPPRRAAAPPAGPGRGRDRGHRDGGGARGSARSMARRRWTAGRSGGRPACWTPTAPPTSWSTR